MDEMLLDDLLKHGGRAGVIPDAVGIDNRDGPILADAQAIGFGAIYSTLAGQLQFFEPGFQVFPCLMPRGLFTAFGVGLVTAQENMPANVANAEFFEALLQRGVHQQLSIHKIYFIYCHNYKARVK